MTSPHNGSPESQRTPPQPSEIAGFQKIYPNERDDNLPEVYVDDSPQALPGTESHQTEAWTEVTSPKFSVADTLKTPVSPEVDGSKTAGGAAGGEGADGGAAKKDGRICGLRRKWFFIALGVVLVVVIAAAVGGGVGGAVASSASGSGDGDGSESEESPSPTSTSDPSS